MYISNTLRHTVSPSAKKTKAIGICLHKINVRIVSLPHLTTKEIPCTFDKHPLQKEKPCKKALPAKNSKLTKNFKSVSNAQKCMLHFESQAVAFYLIRDRKFTISLRIHPDDGYEQVNASSHDFITFLVYLTSNKILNDHFPHTTQTFYSIKNKVQMQHQSRIQRLSI